MLVSEPQSEVFKEKTLLKILPARSSEYYTYYIVENTEKTHKHSKYVAHFIISH